MARSKKRHKKKRQNKASTTKLNIPQTILNGVVDVIVALVSAYLIKKLI